MSKSFSVKAVAGVLFALVVVCVYRARAGETVSNECFSSGTSFEYYSLGEFDPVMSDEGDRQGPYFWFADPTNDLGHVLRYKTGAAYDYAEHALSRSAYLTNSEPRQTRYMSVQAEQDLHRSIFNRNLPDGAFSNVVVRSGTRESIYCDLLTQFTVSEDYPAVDETSRVIVWVRLSGADSGEAATNLMVTAGFVTNDFTKTAPRHYCLDLPDFDVSKWYRLTIRAHGDVSRKGTGLSAFSVYLDGKPVRCVSSEYAICDAADRLSSWLTPEARALAADRRLFPGLTEPGANASYTVSGFTFSGNGFIDDITFSSENPGYAQPEAVFTLNWDGGFSSLGYSLDGGLTTNEAPARTARSMDVLLGPAPTNGLTLKVYAEYDTVGGYKPGVWLGSNGAMLTNGTEFVFDGTTRNPIATVASSRDSVRIGGGEGSYDTFLSAFAALDRSTNAVKVLELAGDETVVTVSRSKTGDAYGNRDQGYVWAKNPDGEYVLDLCGHTLRGSGRMPTLVVNCKSLLIRDSGDSNGRKTGRIQPPGSNTDESSRLNTAVWVYPQSGKGVVPVLTIEDGICDGWVRNDPDEDAQVSVTGVVRIAGGSFISTNGASFYLESYVTNPMLQYVYRQGYWAALTNENVIVWTGLGDGRRWVDGENWKVHRPPNANETALFPSRAAELGPWTVDVESNRMTTTSIWLEGDIRLSGTNDFTLVKVAGDGAGRICGDARLIFDGDQPGRLTETMLRADWAGTVLVRRVGLSLPKVLKGIETWGTATSTVVFNGVRGYVTDVQSHVIPYAFVLQDLVTVNANHTVVTNLAWQNDSGYTGSTLAFTGPLTGDGTFKTAVNLRAIYQLYRFSEVGDFRGRFIVNGKRVLLGSETVMASKPGLIAFGDGATVRSGLGWTCRTAAFGTNLRVIGGTNDVLVTCTAEEPDVTVCTNVCVVGCTNAVWLACTNEPKWSVYLTCERPAWTLEPDPATFSSLAENLSVGSLSGDAEALSSAALRAAAVAAAENAIEQAEVSIEFDDGGVCIVIGNATPGQWYGVRHRASLAADWDEESKWLWKKATGATVRISYSVDETGAGFYGIVGSVDDPQTGEILDD